MLTARTGGRGREGGSGLIEVVPGLMIWTLICFGIAFFVLRKFAFGPIQKTIDERRDRIRAGGRGGGQRPQRGARAAGAEPRRSSRRRAPSPPSILAEARKVADAQIERAKQEAEAERQRRLEDTRKQIEAETVRAIGQIRAEVADLTLEATERVVGKVLDAEDQRRLIDEAVEGLDFSALEGRTELGDGSRPPHVRARALRGRAATQGRVDAVARRARRARAGDRDDARARGVPREPAARPGAKADVLDEVTDGADAARPQLRPPRRRRRAARASSGRSPRSSRRSSTASRAACRSS